MTDISVQRIDYQAERRIWLAGTHGTEPGDCPSITLDVSAFTAMTHYPHGFIQSGEPLALSNGLYVPYATDTVVNEVQKLTPASSGATTVKFDGVSAAATTFAADSGGATTLQGLLEGLPGIAPGDVTITVGSSGDAGKLIVTFGGAWAGKNVPALVVSGTGTALTSTDGSTTPAAGDKAAGLLFATVKVPNLLDTSINVGGALFVHGMVNRSRLIRDPGDAFFAALPLLYPIAA